jgi:hypothetical protein
MSKRTVTYWWIWGLVALLPGAILIPSATGALVAHLDTVARGSGYDFFGDGYAMTMVGLIAAGGVIAIGGIVAQIVSWIGAVLNVRQLADTRWFSWLLWAGVAGLVTTPVFGLGTLVFGGAMVAYLVAGPDASAPEPGPTTPPKTTIVRWAAQGFAVAVAGLVVSLITPQLTGPGRPLHGLVWPSLAIVSAGLTAAAVGAVVISAAWWGAVFNTHRLPDRTWFNRLVWTGVLAMLLMPLFGLGALILAAVMIAYRRSAPDGLAVQEIRTLQLEQPVGAARTRV